MKTQPRSLLEPSRGQSPRSPTASLPAKVYQGSTQQTQYQVKPYDIEKLRKEREEEKKKKDKKQLTAIELIRRSNRLSAMLENEFM